MTITEIMARAMIDVPGDIVSLSVSGNPGDWAKARERVVGITLAALTEAGYAIVPLEPTEQMIANGLFEAECCTDDWTASAACLPGHVWKAMVRAACAPVTGVIPNGHGRPAQVQPAIG